MKIHSNTTFNKQLFYNILNDIRSLTKYFQLYFYIYIQDYIHTVWNQIKDLASGLFGVGISETLTMYKIIYLKENSKKKWIKVNFIHIEAACNGAKSQIFFQISAHVSLISEMLVAHHLRKFSPESKMEELRLIFKLRFLNVGGPEGSFFSYTETSTLPVKGCKFRCFIDLNMSRPGFEHPAFCMRGDRSHRLGHSRSLICDIWVKI